MLIIINIYKLKILYLFNAKMIVVIILDVRIAIFLLINYIYNNGV